MLYQSPCCSLLHHQHHVKTYINLKCKTAWWNLQKLKLIRNTLTREAAHTIALGLIISHLVYANSLLIGLPKCDIDRMQKLQNATAWLVVQDETLTTKGVWQNCIGYQWSPGLFLRWQLLCTDALITWHQGIYRTSSPSILLENKALDPTMITENLMYQNKPSLQDHLV